MDLLCQVGHIFKKVLVIFIFASFSKIHCDLLLSSSVSGMVHQEPLQNTVCWFPIDAVAKNRKLHSLKQYKWIMQ